MNGNNFIANGGYNGLINYVYFPLDFQFVALNAQASTHTHIHTQTYIWLVDAGRFIFDFLNIKDGWLIDYFSERLKYIETINQMYAWVQLWVASKRHPMPRSSCSRYISFWLWYFPMFRSTTCRNVAVVQNLMPKMSGMFPWIFLEIHTVIHLTFPILGCLVWTCLEPFWHLGCPRAGQQWSWVLSLFQEICNGGATGRPQLCLLNWAD